MVNLFNLSDAARPIRARVDMEQIGLERDRWYTVGAAGNWFDARTGELVIDRSLEAWGAEVLEIQEVASG